MDFNLMDGEEIGLLTMFDDERVADEGELNLLSAGDMGINAPELSRGHSLDCGSPISKKSKTQERSSASSSFSANEMGGRQQQRSAPVATVTQRADLNPEELAEIVAVKATEELRANGLSFMEQEGNTFRTLEEFRHAFNGANGAAMDSDDENGGESDNEGGGKKRKRTKRPNNPDADLIERATEEQVQILGIDCRGTEGKKQRRRIRNRMSAQLHRERKRLYIDALECFVKLKEERIGALERDVKKLAKENDALKHSHPRPLTSLEHHRHPQHLRREAGASTSSSSGGSVISGHDPSSLGATDLDTHSEHSSSPLHVPSFAGPGDAGAVSSAGEGMSDDERSILESLLEEPPSPSATGSTDSLRGKGAASGTGIRVAAGMAPLFPLLSVICLLALVMRGGVPGPYKPAGSIDIETGSGAGSGGAMTLVPSSSSPKTDDSASPPSLHRRLSSLPVAGKETDLENSLLALPAPESEGVRAHAGHAGHVGALNPLTVNSAALPSAPTDLRYLISGEYAEGYDAAFEKGLILWKYQSKDLLTTLYPRRAGKVTLQAQTNVAEDDGVSGARRNTSTSEADLHNAGGTAKGHLRRRATASTISTTATGSALAQKAMVASTAAARARATEDAVGTAAATDSASAGTGAGAGAGPAGGGGPGVGPSVGIHSTSRVVIQKGMALLDPGLTATVNAAGAGAAGAAGGGDGNDHKASESTPGLLVNYNPHDNTAGATHSAPRSQNHAHVHPSTAPATVTVGVDEASPHVVMMLIPASSVRWGSSWTDSVPGTQVPLHYSHANGAGTNTNTTGYASASASESAEDYSGTGTGTSEAYIELGCSVFKANVVKNVQMHTSTGTGTGTFGHFSGTGNE